MKYEAPKFEILELAADVITTSFGEGDGSDENTGGTGGEFD